MFPMQPPTGHYICGYYLSDIDALGNGDQSDSQVLHHDCNSLAPSSHLGTGIHDTQAMRQAGSPPSGVCVITCMLLPKIWSLFEHI